MTQSAEMWEHAEAGDETTARVLAGLPRDEWTVYQDVRWPSRQYADIDHVVLGPAGIFVIDSKSWPGRITFSREGLRQNGHARDSTLTAASEAAEAIATMVTTVDQRHVYPVLCFVRDEWLTGQARDVLVCSTSNLEAMLLARKPVLRPEQLRAAARQLESGFREASGSATPPRVRAVRASRRALRAERQSDRRSLPLALRPDVLAASFMAAFGAIALIWPQWISSLAEVIAGGF